MRQVGDDVEVTPEMIKAGLDAYWGNLPYDANREADDDRKVKEIYLAMAAKDQH